MRDAVTTMAWVAAVLIAAAAVYAIAGDPRDADWYAFMAFFVVVSGAVRLYRTRRDERRLPHPEPPT